MGRLPYWVCHQVLSIWFNFFLRRLEPKLWIRNSYLTKAFKPFKSDLDLTLLLLHSPNEKETNRIRSILRITKTIFPALGETNLYVEDELFILDGLVNAYELSRDPKLQKHRPSLRASDQVSTKYVWLLRLLEADFQNLGNNPLQRMLKWEQHFERVNLSLPVVSPFSRDTLVERICAEYLRELAPSADKALLPLYFGEKLESIPHYKMIEQEWFSGELFALLPHRFCFAAPNLIAASLKTNLHGRLTLEQIAWEIFGIYTQFRLMEKSNVLKLHIERLLFVLTSLSASDTQERRRQELLERIQTLLPIFLR